MSATFVARGRTHAGQSPRHRDPTDQLRFIRRTMERAGPFTAMSGAGQVIVGGIGLVAAAVAMQMSTPGRWLAVWLGAAVLAVTVAGWTLSRKATRLQVPLWSGPTLRFALSFCPPLVAGAILTLVVQQTVVADRLPGIWLLVYGASVTAGGAASIGIIPVMGGCFMTVGLAALAAPTAWGDWFMALGFGVLHILFGIVIARRHGG